MEFTGDPSHDRHMRMMLRDIQSRPATEARGAAADQATWHDFPLVAFLITEGTEDTLHESYLASHVELDIASSRAVLFLDIADPNVKGPTVQHLVEVGVFACDPNAAAAYARACDAAGGEMPYRRQEITKLRQRLRLSEEVTPFLAVVSVSNPELVAILRIPDQVVTDRSAERQFWKAVVRSLSEERLAQLDPTGRWSTEGAFERLQEALDELSHAVAPVPDRVSRDADRGRSRPRMTTDLTNLFRQRPEGTWDVQFAGKYAPLPDWKGLRYVQILFRCPREDVTARELWQGDAPESQVRIGDGGRVLDAAAAKAYRRRLSELAESRVEAEARLDSDELERIATEAQAIEDALTGGFGIGGRPRCLGDEDARIVASVAREIGRVRKRMEKYHPELASHLALITTGAVCRYEAPPGTEWCT